MKKIICLSAVLLILVGVTCAMAADAKVTKTVLTKENQAVLKGTWAGTMDFSRSEKCNMVMEIANDAAPFKGTMNLSNLPPSVATFPGNFANATTYGGPFENGIITNKGDFLISGQAGNMGEFTLMGQTKLTGWFYLWGTRGTITLTKKAAPAAAPAAPAATKK
jgi:hypothetical protein